MNTNPCVSYTQPIIILDDSVQKVGVFTNSKTTSQIGVLLNRITSGLDEEKKSYGLQCNVQNGRLQLNQYRTLYAFLMNMERHVSYLLMVRVTLASNLVRKSILEFGLIVELLVKLGQKFPVIQSMILFINLAT